MLLQAQIQIADGGVNFSTVVWKENMLLCHSENAVSKFFRHSVNRARLYDGSVTQAGCSIWISVLLELCYTIETSVSCLFLTG